MLVREVAPSPSLRPFIRCYHYTEMSLGRAKLRKPLTARPEQMLQFALGRPFTVIDRVTGATGRAPDVVLVGRQTRRNLDLEATGELATLTVHFQPAGFHRLFHLPMHHMTDRADDAADVLGSPALELQERVAGSTGLADRIAHIERFLASRLDTCRPPHAVQSAAAEMLRDSSPNVGTMAAERDLSLRQFERAFRDQVGVRPKLFSRIARFAYALQCKSDHPDRSWAEVAADAGYFDQAHFIKDCWHFAGETPSALIRTWIDCRP